MDTRSPAHPLAVRKSVWMICGWVLAINGIDQVRAKLRKRKRCETIRLAATFIDR
ncbi:hypothetical protein AB4Y36_35850 [Paraburkholderia sp. BR10936]|uniref:hypothetical protein n=1 Tax=Paraburkholderia sp. BR10936 TaxID=3236993 RepID=UPI0034D34728